MALDRSADRPTPNGRHRPGPRRAPRRGRGIMAVSAGGLAAVLSLTVLVCSGWFWYNYRSLDAGVRRVTVTGLGEDATPGATAEPQNRQVDGRTQNILVIGTDSRAGLSTRQQKQLKVGSDAGSTSTDTLMIIHVPADGSRATLISIPRDSYVDIPGHPQNKINAAYVDGYLYTPGATTDDQRTAAGLSTLIATLKNLTGLSIDHYVMVSFLGFYNIAKTIDGIPVDLCHATDDTADHNESLGLGRVGSGFRMSAGKHDLTPLQTLEFVRQRHNLPGLGDFAREARQRYFLAAAFDKIASAHTLLSPSRLGDIIGAVRSTLTIDPGLSLPALADQMLDLSAGNIRGQTVPTEGSDLVDGVGDVERVDPARVHARIKAWLAAPGPAESGSAASESAASASTTPSGTSSGSGRRAASVAQAAPKGCIN